MTHSLDICISVFACSFPKQTFPLDNFTEFSFFLSEMLLFKGYLIRQKFKNDPEHANIFVLSIDGTACGEVGIGDGGHWICWFASLA